MLQTVDLDRGGFACALGGPDGTTLFIVAAEWRGMTESEMVTPGSGQVLTDRGRGAGRGLAVMPATRHRTATDPGCADIKRSKNHFST